MGVGKMEKVSYLSHYKVLSKKVDMYFSSDSMLLSAITLVCCVVGIVFTQ